jgi:isoleucyl-tRNA synthetase
MQVDRYVLHEVAILEKSALEGYESYVFSKCGSDLLIPLMTGLNGLHSFAANTLSSLYLDYVKDILYCQKRDDPARQAILSTLSHVSARVYWRLIRRCPGG